MKMGTRQVLRHASARAIAVATEPVSCVMLLLASLSTLLFWPGISDSSGGIWSAFAPAGSWGEDPVPAVVVFVMLLTWPMLPAYYAAGRATGRGRDALISRGAPALPVGPVGRAIGELMVIFGCILIVRLPFLALLSPGGRDSFLEDTLFGCLVFLPPLAAWTSRSSDIGFSWVKCVVGTVPMFAALAFGLVNRPVALAALSLVLSAAFLATSGREFHLGRVDIFAFGGECALSRPPMPPERRFWRDLWEMPLRKTWPVLTLLAVLVAAALVADSLLPLPPYAFYFTAVIALGFAASPLCLRPMGSNLVMMGLMGKQGARQGDFARALTALPLGIETVARGAYAHGLAASGSLWAGALALVAVRTFLRTGQWGLRAADGDDVSKFFWLSLSLVPCIAGFLAAGAVGNRALTMLSGGALLGLFNVVGIAVLIASAIFPRGSKGPLWVGLALIITFVLLGGLPPLALMRRPARVASVGRGPSGNGI